MKRDDTTIQFDPKKELFDLAASSGLELMSTGGGFDYFTKKMETGSARPESVGPIMVLGVPGDAGGPERLDEPATVTIYFDADDWSNSKALAFEFDTAKQAIDFMAGNHATFARGLDKVVWR